MPKRPRPPPETHVFLSPHFDDAAFSCGATISGLVKRGASVIIITVFSGPARTRLSPYAKRLVSKWGFRDSKEACKARLKEDLKASKTLGLRARSLRYLDLPDGIYRFSKGKPLYTRGRALFNRVHRADRALVEQLARELEKALPKTHDLVLYAPLGVGKHVDHTVVHRAVRKLRRAGMKLRFYDDVPYALFPGATTWIGRRARAGKLKPELVRMRKSELELKLRAAKCYKSQLTWSREEIFRALRTYFSAIGGQAERQWRRAPN